MTDLKASVKASISGDTQNKSVDKTENITVADKFVNKKPAPPKKKRRGRPSKQQKETKLNTILKSRNMTRKDLTELIEKKYPEEPISPDAVSRIVSGSRLFYSTTTLFRICGALNITPNMALDYEQHV
jgi:DNA-binding Xre family transcriptional regulator